MLAPTSHYRPTSPCILFFLSRGTGRQFKEAARIASEVKTITGRVEEVKQQISDSETKLAGLNKELTQHSEELEAVKNEADAQEKEEGNTVYTYCTHMCCKILML